MEVTKERFEDAREKDGDGDYHYYYAGFYFNFKNNNESFVVRHYEDAPEEVSFLIYSAKYKKEWKQHRLDKIPYDNSLFCEAVRYLVEKEGVRRIKILLNGYSEVDIKKAVKTL